MTLKLRNAQKRDCKFLWLLRNHPDSRKFQFNKEEIPYQEHLKWFNNSLGNKNRKIYIAENNKKRVGQIRFDREITFAIVNVEVNPMEKGKGYGSQIISEGSKRYFEEEKVDIIMAEILEENVASVKVFERAGYRFNQRKGKVLEYLIQNGKI